LALRRAVIGASPRFAPRKIALDPKACDGATFRFEAEGWGLVQLYLQTQKSSRLESSHTNHNSLKRAETWAVTTKDVDAPARWDFARITAFSSRLNRQIRKRAVAKLGSRPVLAGALALWDAGVTLVPYAPGEASIKRV
jgi:hypothetical protein